MITGAAKVHTNTVSVLHTYFMFCTEKIIKIHIYPRHETRHPPFSAWPPALFAVSCVSLCFDDVQVCAAALTLFLCSVGVTCILHTLSCAGGGHRGLSWTRKGCSRTHGGGTMDGSAAGPSPDGDARLLEDPHHPPARAHLLKAIPVMVIGCLAPAAGGLLFLLRWVGVMEASTSGASSCVSVGLMVAVLGLV